MKQPELLSALAAGVLGMGISILFANLSSAFAVLILLIGLASHSLGMSRMRSLEQQANSARARWMEIRYQFCRLNWSA